MAFSAVLWRADVVTSVDSSMKFSPSHRQKLGSSFGNCLFCSVRFWRAAPLCCAAVCCSVSG